MPPRFATSFSSRSCAKKHEVKWLGAVIGFFAIAAASSLLLFRANIDRSDDLATWLLITPALPTLVFAGWLGLRGIPLGSVALRSFTGTLLSLAIVYQRFPQEGVASPVFRSMLAFPLLQLLVAAVGAALAYVLWGSGRFDLRFAYERFVGFRYLRSLRGTVLSIVTNIALIGVVLGVSLLIVALAILSGFEGDLIEKMMGAHSHLAVSKMPGYAFEAPDADRVEAEAKKLGAAHATRFVNAEVLIASDSNHTEGHLYGFDVKTAPPVYSLLTKIVEGGLERLPAEAPGAPHLLPPTEAPAQRRLDVPVHGDDDEGHGRLFPPKAPEQPRPSSLPGVIIGVEMAKQLHVELGDPLTVVSPLIEELTPQGPASKAKVFRVAGVFEAKLYEIDAHEIIVALADAQHFLELGTDVSGVALAFDDPREAEPAGKRIVSDMGGYPLQALSWEARDKNLFSALKLEKAVAFIVLIFIVLVASFSIVNTLTMTVIEKAREIAILKTMGALDVSISKIFLVQGATVGLVGTALGVLAGCGLAVLLSSFGFYIDPSVYNVDRLPIRLHAADVLQVATLGCLLTSLSAIFPALAGARLSPVEGLRYE
jgi:lipoprotein-releasing system permease protein